MRRMLVLLAVSALCGSAAAAKPLELGSRLELFVDDALVDASTGDIGFVLHKPAPQEVVLVTDQPWEGNICAYYAVFRDGDLYRMYYRGAHYDEVAKRDAHRQVTCYAESRDGVHWTRPELGLYEFAGSKQNNIVWDGLGTHCFAPFKDTHPDCEPAARYKAISAGQAPAAKGLYVFQSPDAIHWSLLRQDPVITEGAFDSQNLAFWDGARGRYADYHRTFHEGVRDIMTATSRDFVNWTPPVLLKYTGAPRQHLYTNAVLPYERAPHILIGFPTRFLPKEGQRVEPTFMSSRDGLTFHRWDEPLISKDAPQDRSGNRSNYMAWGLVQLPGNDQEYSVYATEAYYRGPASRLRRFTYRVDGFVSVSAKQGGQLVTKPLTFAGRRLLVNYATSGEGRLRVELRDEHNVALKGFALADCQPLRGDAIAQPVAWAAASDLGPLAGRPIRICFDLAGADLYSLRFAP